MSEIISVSATSSKATHKVSAKAFEKIAELSGSGTVGEEETSLSPDATLDLTGYKDSEAISDENKKEITSLLSKAHQSDEPKKVKNDGNNA